MEDMDQVQDTNGVRNLEVAITKEETIKIQEFTENMDMETLFQSVKKPVGFKKD